MSLSISLYYKLGKKEKRVEVFYKNITHNLSKMAKAVDYNFYETIWKGSQFILPKDIFILKNGLEKLLNNKNFYKNFEPSNGWGTYEDLVSFVEDYINALEEFPDAKRFVSA